MNDPVDGDGFAQFDRRVVDGGDVGFRRRADLFGMPAIGTVGVQTRVDDVSTTLGTQTLRVPAGTTVGSETFTVSYVPFAKAEMQSLLWMRFAGGVRGGIVHVPRDESLRHLRRATGGSKRVRDHSP